MIKESLEPIGEERVNGYCSGIHRVSGGLNVRVAFWVAAGLYRFVFFGTMFFMTDTFMGLTINEMTTFGLFMALGMVFE
ncbi:hypothetical protein O9993_06540 [Vibrio lentus]|nr:hypothetical protein [Vibrio lentus]